MKLTRLTKISLGFLLAYGSVAQAEMAGRVLVAVGDVSATRADKTVALKSGDEVQSGDTLRVGEASNMQVRFTDEGIVALRPNTVFRIDDYKFAKQADKDSSVFSLVKGGMRTITGLIGKLSRNNYAVKAPTATIGIRGTNFTIVVCSNDCRNADGSLAPNGTYGGVSDGRIASSNQAGEREFGKNEFFYVASSSVLPTVLMAPPGFLRDRLEGEAKAGGKGKAPTVASTATASSSSSSSGTAGTSITTTISTVPAITTPVVPYVPGEQPIIVTGGVPPTFQYAVAGAAAGIDTTYPSGYSATRGGEQAIVSFTGLTVDQVKAALTADLNGTASNNRGLEEAILGGLTTPSSVLMGAWGYTATYTNYSGYLVTETYTKEAAVDVGTNADAGNVTWGRFHYTSQETGGRTYSDSAWEHLAVGDPVISMPTSGTAQFNWVGGTSPTDSAGNVGTLTSGGSWSVSFSSGSPTINSVTPVTWSMGSLHYSLSIASPTTIGTSTSTMTSPFPISTRGYSSIPVTVSVDTTPGTVNGYITPAFTGSQAQGLVMGINTFGSGVNPTASVQVYKR